MKKSWWVFSAFLTVFFKPGLFIWSWVKKNPA